MKQGVFILFLIMLNYQFIHCVDSDPPNYTQQTDAKSTTDCTLPCGECWDTVLIGGIESSAPASVNGAQFYVNKNVISDILTHYEDAQGSTDWEGKSFSVQYVEKTLIMTVYLSTYTDDYAAEEIVEGTLAADDQFFGQSFFDIGGTLKFLYYKKCETCISNDANRLAEAQQCVCKTGYTEKNDAAYSCIVNCSRQCKSEQCVLGDPTKCSTCQDESNYAPDCLYPKVGYLQKDSNGTPSYETCNQRCAACRGEVDNCASPYEILQTSGASTSKCNGLNRDEDNNCFCNQGYYDNQGENIDCLKCAEHCTACTSLQQCTLCEDNLNRVLNEFTGQCECGRGYQEQEPYTSVCKRCYTVSDQCVEQCPPNTVANETDFICETLSYDMISHAVLIYVLAALIIVIEVAVCFVMKSKLFKNIVILKKERTIRKILQAKQMRQDEEEMKLKQTTLMSSPIKSHARKSRKATKGFKFNVDKSNLDSTANLNDNDITNGVGLSSNQLLDSTQNNHMGIKEVEPLKEGDDDPNQSKLVKRQRSRFLSKRQSKVENKLSIDENTIQPSENRNLVGMPQSSEKIGDFTADENQIKPEDGNNDGEGQEGLDNSSPVKGRRRGTKRLTKRMSKLNN